MKKFLMLMLLGLFMFSCTPEKKSDFVNFSNQYECNIPMVRTLIDSTAVDFIIDTGAGVSLIDEEWYDENKDEVIFVNTVEMELHGIGGSTENVTSDVVRMNLPVGNVTLVESNLSSVKNKLNKEGYNVIGIIGSDFFKTRNYIIDFEKRMLYPANKKDSINEIAENRKQILPSAHKLYVARKELGLTVGN
jgi:hypothetical protein